MNFTGSVFKVLSLFLLVLPSFLVLAQTDCMGPGTFSIEPSEFSSYDETTNTYVIENCDATFTLTTDGLSAEVSSMLVNPGIVLVLYTDQPSTSDVNNDPNSTLNGIPDPQTSWFLIDNGDFSLGFLGSSTWVLVPVILPDVDAFTLNSMCGGVDPTFLYPTFILQCNDCVVGEPCDDMDPLTENDVVNQNCECVGEPICTPGEPCDDMNAITENDVYDDSCECIGEPICTPGEPCDDMNAITENDVYDDSCECIGEPICTPGESCDDMDPNTANDVYDDNCVCAGAPITDDCESNPIVITEEEYLCDEDSGEFSFTWSFSGGAPEIDPTETYTVVGTGLASVDLFFGAPLTVSYSDGMAVDISVTDSNGCMATWTTGEPIACVKSCDVDIILELVSAECAADSMSIDFVFSLDGGDPPTNPDGAYVISSPLFDDFEVGVGTFDLNLPTGALGLFTVSDNEGCEAMWESDGLLNCGADFDCPNEMANVGDPCEDINGNTSALSENCTCPPAPECDDPISYTINFECAPDDEEFTYSWVFSGGAPAADSTSNYFILGTGIAQPQTVALGETFSLTFVDGTAVELIITDDFGCEATFSSFGPVFCSNGFDCPDEMVNFGDACEDANGNDSVIGLDCECVTAALFDCQDIMANIGDPCDDGDANTVSDQINIDCVCEGKVICEGAILTIIDAQDCDETTGDYNIFIKFEGGLPSVDPSALYFITGDINGSFSVEDGVSGITVVIGDQETFNITISDGTDCEASLDIGPVNCIKYSIELSDFYGKIRESSNTLHWTTATETDNDYFVIERSANGNAFEALGVVQGQTNSLVATDYIFEDNAPLKGLNFYRLRSVDVFGLSEFSEVILLDRSDDGATNEISIYPNPINDILIVESPEENALISIYHTDGRLLHSSRANYGSQLIDLSHLPAGLFYLKVVGNTFEYTDRIIKQ